MRILTFCLLSVCLTMSWKNLKNLASVQTCSNGFYGTNCEFYRCFGVLFSEESCSNRGTCIKPDQCECEQSFVGENCQHKVCNGISDCQSDWSSVYGGKVQDESLVSFGDENTEFRSPIIPSYEFYRLKFSVSLDEDETIDQEYGIQLFIADTSLDDPVGDYDLMLSISSSGDFDLIVNSGSRVYHYLVFKQMQNKNGLKWKVSGIQMSPYPKPKRTLFIICTAAFFVCAAVFLFPLLFFVVFSGLSLSFCIFELINHPFVVKKKSKVSKKKEKNEDNIQLTKKHLDIQKSISYRTKKKLIQVKRKFFYGTSNGMPSIFEFKKDYFLIQVPQKDIPKKHLYYTDVYDLTKKKGGRFDLVIGDNEYYILEVFSKPGSFERKFIRSIKRIVNPEETEYITEVNDSDKSVENADVEINIEENDL